MSKALLIRSYQEKEDVPGKWHQLSDIKPYIAGIKTGELSDNIDIELINSLISGIPTPWARAKLFWFAFDYLTTDDAYIEYTGLTDYYKILANEWKGIIAVLALFRDRISFSAPIYFDNSTEIWDNAYDVFGKMLFDDYDLWCEPDRLKKDSETKPYIQILYYGENTDKTPIGALSPFSIVFSGVEYSELVDIRDIPWFKQGKFDDPINYLDDEQAQKLYLFLINLSENLIDFEKKINLNRGKKTPLNLSPLKTYINHWEKDITRRFRGIVKKGPIPGYDFESPYKELFSNEIIVYKNKADGALSFNKAEKAEQIDIQKVLLDTEELQCWYESEDRLTPLSKSSVYLLKVDYKDDTLYFALPLSIEGIKLFQTKLGDLLKPHSRTNRLTGRINENGKLVVSMSLQIDESIIKLSPKEYKIDYQSPGRRVLIWPNFISDYWNRYYFYSEFPSNLVGIKYVPFYKDCKNNQKILEEDDNFIFFNSDDGTKERNGLKIRELVKYPASAALSDDYHKYEIIRSNKPIAGVEIRKEVGGQIQKCGYLIVKAPNDDSMDQPIKDLTSVRINEEAVVGIDFGSTNTSVSYSTSNDPTKSRQIPFKNRRLALVGSDKGTGEFAERHELLFFQNDDAVPPGQIKSWILEHDSRYVSTNQDEEIAGGVPINEPNIDIKNMNRSKIETNNNVGTIYHNTKWLIDEKGLSNKKAFLKTIWLSICADLYADGIKPKRIRWSYPGSFSTTDLINFRQIFINEIPTTTPILDDNYKEEGVNADENMTEAVADCRFSLTETAGVGLMENNVFLGIDVGGSTSDILLLYKGKQLLKQGSVRIAAGAFFDAITLSKKFREAVLDFYESKRQDLNLNITNIGDMIGQPDKSPYFLNCLFDQLSGEQHFRQFYGHLGPKVPFVFALPTYITGLIVFYAGKLISKMIKEKELNQIVKRIDLMPFGKGGRIFDWLDKYIGEANALHFYSDCLNAALESDISHLQLVKNTDIRVVNKSEVSIGLAVDKDIDFDESAIKNSDVFGEQGYKRSKSDGKKEKINEDETISPSDFENLDNLIVPEKFYNFEKFLEIFTEFVKKYHLVSNTKTLKERSNKVYTHFRSFVENDPEYHKAKDNSKSGAGEFDYKHPLLVTQGTCYMEKVLIPFVFDK